MIKQNQQPFNMFRPAMFEHQGSVQQQQQQAAGNAAGTTAGNSANGIGNVAQQAAEAEQRARQTMQMPISQPAGTTAEAVHQHTEQARPVITSADQLAAAMGYTSPEEEERRRRASVANQRILAVGDALRHIGNIATTVNYAPAQKFNNPVVEESERYQKGKALRDAANMRYYTYQQARAKQEAQQRQWEAQAARQAATLAETVRHNQVSEALTSQRNADRNAYYDRMLTGRENYNQSRIDIARQNAETSRIRANKVGSGGRGSRGGSNMPDYEVLTENTLNDDGRIISQKKTRTVKRGGQSTTSTTTTSRGNNAPPSRQRQQTSNADVPPSRRKKQ